MFNIDFGKIEDIIQSTIEEYGQRIFDEAMNGLDAPSVRATWVFNKTKGRVEFYTDEELAAYIEFGTGQFAKNYLSGKSQEMRDDAIKFKKPKDGTMDAQPYLFPVYYKYKNEIVLQIDKRIQQYLDTIKF